MRYSCVKCQRFFKIKRNGVVMEEGLPVGEATRADGQAVNWLPYKLYMADLYECEKCGAQLAVAALKPIREHFMGDYQQVREIYNSADRLLPMVEDC